MATVTVSTKFQVVIPKKLREALGIQPGQKIQVLEYEGRLEFIPIRPIKTLRGSIKGMNTTVERDAGIHTETAAGRQRCFGYGSHAQGDALDAG